MSRVIGLASRVIGLASRVMRHYNHMCSYNHVKYHHKIFNGITILVNLEPWNEEEYVLCWGDTLANTFMADRLHTPW